MSDFEDLARGALSGGIDESGADVQSVSYLMNCDEKWPFWSFAEQTVEETREYQRANLRFIPRHLVEALEKTRKIEEGLLELIDKHLIKTEQGDLT